MVIDFLNDRSCRCLHSDLIPLQSIGTLTVRRASNVLFDEHRQEWFVITATAPVKELFHHPSRAECLKFEEENFEQLI